MREEKNANSREVRYGINEQNKAKRIGWGLLLLAVGVLFILRNLGFIPPHIDDMIFTWQSILIAVGIVKFLFDDNKALGAITILFGAFFLVPELFDVRVDFIDVFWPLLLIGAGLLIILGPGKNLLKKRNPSISTDQRYIEEINIFGGNEKVMEEANFKGGTIQNIFGGTELDMRDCEMEGDSAEIDLVCVFGGLELRVPDHWDVVVKVTPVFGGFSNKRSVRVREGMTKKTLFITGVVVFGGGEIK